MPRDSQKTARTLFTPRTAHILPILALLLIVAVWLHSLPTQITAVNDPLPDPTGEFTGLLQLIDDSGEFIIAWHTWGVVHAPGYPLLSLLANLWTRLIDPLRLYPATAANLLSFFAALGALLLMVRPLARMDRWGTAVAAALLLPAFGILVWMYAVVAEAYAFGLLLAFGLILLALALGEQPTKQRLLLLGLLFGLAVGHHRTLVFLGPALLAAAWPALKLGWRVWLGSALLATATLLIYLYLPLVAWAGSPWIYGRSPATWEGFSDAFFAREYSYRLLPPTTLPEIGAMLAGRLQYLAQEMSSLGLVVGLFGFAPGLLYAKTRRLAGVLLLAFAGYWLAPISQGLLIRSYMMILVASVTLAAAWGVGLVAMGQWQRWLPPLGLLLTVFIAFQNVSANQSYILFHTKDETGQQLIADAAALPDERPFIGEIWSPRFFPLAYGQLVTGELAHVELVDLREDLSGLPDEPPPLIVVSREVLYAVPPEQWVERYGTAVSLSSHGQRMVAIRPFLDIAPIAPQPLAAAEEIQLVEAVAERLADDTLFVQLWWQAVQPPSRSYSVFVHISDREQILGPDDLVAQQDNIHPVGGFYPTANWRVGELVQDNYYIPLPPGRPAQTVFVGLYTIEEDGRFTNHLAHQLP